MTSRRRRALSPIVVLVVLALVPGAVLFGLWRWAASSAEADEPPPPTTIAPPAPSPTLATPLLSFRRMPGVMARDVNLPPSGRRG